MAQNKEDKDQNDIEKDWEAVFSGTRLPDSEQNEELSADQARQVLLWRQAKQETNHSQQQITPQQAQAYYQHIHNIEQTRRPAKWLRGLKWILPGLCLLGAGVGIGYLLTQPKTTEILTNINSTKATNTTQNTAALNHTSNAVNTASVRAKPPGLLPELVNIPGGTFTMGCTPGWDDTLGGCRDNEYPAHGVTLPPFKLSRHEVTIGQFQHFVKSSGYQTVAEQKQQGCAIKDSAGKGHWIIDKTLSWRNPGFPQTDAHPAVCISWADTQQYLNWLNKETGQTHRLPTEEEWEYAARAGRVTAYYWGSHPDRHFANYDGTGEPDSWKQTSPAGQFTSNPYGLHDMAGNAWEWTQSCWRKNYQNTSNAGENKCVSSIETLRTRRGGGWDNQPPSIRSAYRSYGSEVERSNVYGFRVAQDIAD